VRKIVKEEFWQMYKDYVIQKPTTAKADASKTKKKVSAYYTLYLMGLMCHSTT
jgi:hypothetical protein